jgi:hypothetical protein
MKETLKSFRFGKNEQLNSVINLNKAPTFGFFGNLVSISFETASDRLTSFIALGDEI